MAIVYLVRNTKNKKGYVGITRRGLETRWDEHVENAKLGRGEMPFYSAIRKHTPDAFEVSVLEECSEDVLGDREKHWIAKLGTFIGTGKGYNATLGGDGGILGHRHSEETRRKMSESRRGKKMPPRTEEHKQKLAEARKGKGTGPRPHARGWRHSDKARAKIGSAHHVKVEQLDLKGSVIATYDSMVEAEAATGVGRKGISRCCRFPHRTACGFRWRYVSAGDR